MSSEDQIARLLAAANAALPEYRKTKPGETLTDVEAGAVGALSTFWLLFENAGVKDGEMEPYLGVATLYKLEQQLGAKGIDRKSARIRLHTSNLARKARELAVSQQKADLEEELRLRSVQRESTTADTNRGIRPVEFEDPTGVQFFGEHDDPDK